MTDKPSTTPPEHISDELSERYKPGSHLVQYNGKKLGRRFIWDSDSITIGSDAHANFQIEEASISPLHAKLLRDGENFFIQGVGNAAGIFVGDNKVNDRTQFVDGDILKIGDIIIKFFERF